MSNELTITASLAYEDNDTSEDSLGVTGLLASVTSRKFTHVKQSIATTETAIDLGGVSSPRYCLIVNRDDTNYVEVKTALGGIIFAYLAPGGVCLVPLGSGAQAPA